MTLDDIFKRVSNWNSARYDQVYNHELCCSLLKEELIESLESGDDIANEIKELCDIVFVAMGGLWKAKKRFCRKIAFSLEVKDLVVNSAIESPQCLLVHFLSLDIKQIEKTLNSIIGLVFSKLSQLGYNEVQFIDFMKIVCDSNDSKKVMRASPSVKVNAGKNKGENYFKAEPLIQQYLEKL